VNAKEFIIGEGDSAREVLDKLDRLTESLGKWGVNTNFSSEALAEMDWRPSNIESLLNK